MSNDRTTEMPPLPPAVEAGPEPVVGRLEPVRAGLRGFGVTITPGGARNWYAGADGVRRWNSNDQPCEPPAVLSSAGLGAWVPVAGCLPASGVTVLACYRNRADKIRRIRACWTSAKTVEANADDDVSEYDEAADCCWIPEGWYEQIDNWGDYSAVQVCEGTVTHWMPLPPPPQSA